MWKDILKLVETEYVKTHTYILFLENLINKPEEYEPEAIEAWKKSKAEQEVRLSWIKAIRDDIEYLAK